MPPPTVTVEEWIALRRLVLLRLLKRTRNKNQSIELTQAAIVKALEPSTKPWDPDDPGGPATFEDYVYNLAWSLYGNELKSFRVLRASFRLDEPQAIDAPASGADGLQLLLDDRETARARRLYAALEVRIEGDPLILVLLDDDDDDDAGAGAGEREDEEADTYGPGNELPAPEEEGETETAEEEAPKPDAPKNPRTLPASTRRALAKGYTHSDIKHARERLKRHALAVVRADREEP